ncbi:cytochrome P450 [Actinosynnema sp. NPDC047251]|uniref:Cytochrome P450 family protein n=1 Tax=Saccharothrix espanaensis (strain ATCC 51144 / DSM 44229 / JCM 9112 / NBRC 15066 / NRRL 15764) TaxID=1179773 RepID=K0K392_SACES|nr:cytochrome P450 [Saccharothrix espanaensis]CCH32047.1 Cytochrome P450 family protein [Saccharothrix espanaensis DSM 44229]
MRTLQLRAMLLGFDAVTRTRAWQGDPLARVVSAKPGTDPYPLYEQARRQGPLSRSKLGLHVTASHRVGDAILRDPRFGVDTRAALMDMKVLLRDAEGRRPIHPVDDSFIALDPPRHTRLRRAVAPWFTPRAMRELTPTVEKVVTEFLDEFDGRAEAELVHEFAARIPIRIICEMFGIAAVDYPRFTRWGAILGPTLDGVRSVAELRRVRETLVDVEAFFADLVDRRRRHPGDDLVSGVIEAHAGATGWAREDLLATVELLMLAGYETTLNLIGNAALVLLTDDRARARLLADPDIAPNLVEEVLRWDSSVQYTVRAATEPATVEGVDLAQGAMVVVLLGGANRDPEVFPDPATLDPDRPNARDHLSFSSGIHYCVGAGLARLEAATAVRLLFRRFPDLRLSGPVRRLPSRNIRGAIRLPVRLRG